MIKLFTKKGMNNYNERIAVLERKLNHQQKEVGVAMNQGAETWHDNSPFECARADLTVTDRMVSELYDNLRYAQIREYPRPNGLDTVEYGTRVVFLRDRKRQEFTLVGYGHGDIDRNRIHYDSPLAQVLIGSKVGQSFDGEVNGRQFSFHILEVYPITDYDLL